MKILKIILVTSLISVLNGCSLENNSATDAKETLSYVAEASTTEEAEISSVTVKIVAKNIEISNSNPEVGTRRYLTTEDSKGKRVVFLVHSGLYYLVDIGEEITLKEEKYSSGYLSYFYNGTSLKKLEVMS